MQAFAAHGSSHTIIVGRNHGYLSFGGLVVGNRNQFAGAYASVSDGYDNDADGDVSSVGGGVGNITTAAGQFLS